MKTPLHEHSRVVGSRWAPDVVHGYLTVAIGRETNLSRKAIRTWENLGKKNCGDMGFLAGGGGGN